MNCKLCSKSFSRPFCMRRHMRNVHMYREPFKTTMNSDNQSSILTSNERRSNDYTSDVRTPPCLNENIPSKVMTYAAKYKLVPLPAEDDSERSVLASKKAEDSILKVGPPHRQWPERPMPRQNQTPYAYQQANFNLNQLHAPVKGDSQDDSLNSYDTDDKYSGDDEIKTNDFGKIPSSEEYYASRGLKGSFRKKYTPLVQPKNRKTAKTSRKCTRAKQKIVKASRPLQRPIPVKKKRVVPVSHTSRPKIYSKPRNSYSQESSQEPSCEESSLESDCEEASQASSYEESPQTSIEFNLSGCPYAAYYRAQAENGIAGVKSGIRHSSPRIKSSVYRTRLDI